MPNANQVTVSFGNIITSPQTVFTETDVTAKVVQFNSANKYAVAGMGRVLLSANSGAASISVTQGNHEFQSPVRLESDTNVNVAAGSISFDNVLDLNGHVFTIQSGTVNIRNIVIPGAGGSIVNGASLGSGGAASLGGDFANIGTLNVELGGTGFGEFSAFNVSGMATLGGSVFAELVGGFTPSIGDSFTVLTAGNLVNNGITLAGPLAGQMSLSVVGNRLVLTATAVPEPATFALLLAALALCAMRLRPRR